MIGFLRSAFSTTLFRPFTGQSAVRTVEAARGMKLMCDGCNFVRRRGRLFVVCKSDPKHKQRQG
ncbi:54S ribosomal protein L36, mitochondrial [Coemansia sp. RSA 1935]|nr:54S ribosomal protein L36, mitochondrial [Coemansia sp. RSA 1591]KAJ2531885.1 54S ribosomal protein L36, mitochondrial [Coemansia sp. RSA 1935]